MAKVNDLLGLGMPPFLARLIGWNVDNAFVAAGATAASAAQIPAGNQVITIVSGTSAVKVPKVGGDGVGYGALGGDEIIINNESGAAIVVFALANDQGSAVTFYGNGVSTAGTTGVSAAIGRPLTFQNTSPSTWIFSGSV